MNSKKLNGKKRKFQIGFNELDTDFNLHLLCMILNSKHMDKSATRTKCLTPQKNYKWRWVVNLKWNWISDIWVQLKHTEGIVKKEMGAGEVLKMEKNKIGSRNENAKGPKMLRMELKKKWIEEKQHLRMNDDYLIRAWYIEGFRLLAMADKMRLGNSWSCIQLQHKA